MVLDLTLAGLPPAAPIALSFHGVFDFAARGRALPWDYQLVLSRVNADGVTRSDPVLELSGFNAVDFPVAGDWSGAGVADASGVAFLDLFFEQCRERAGAVGGGCLVLPGSYLVARVVDPAPWEAAPACD
jgi:hypothetical protein